MPVVTPSAASIETVKLVWYGEVLSLTMGFRPSWRVRCSVKVRQSSPRASRTMKLTSSGRTICAAITRSPSFSRSSSSRITTMRPARMSSRMSGMVLNAIRLAFGLVRVGDEE